METRTKKLKLLRELITLDPFYKVCGDLYELMLQHFDKYEVFNASEVSPEWNETISTSSKCMTQLPLRLSSNRIPRVISKSNRQYNDLEVECYRNKTIEIVQPKLQLEEKFAPLRLTLTFEKVEKAKKTGTFFTKTGISKIKPE
jgi:hypothetical protein